ncbi:hypothetical protein PDN54_08085 [Bacillus cereus group sp. Bc252]|uniref:hypothetical protein n=1 Tax=Bacillus TaxID=1386 RepID=UPI0021D006DE|nr:MULTISPECIES: hypothetical protein [Bacillus cereus group]MCU5206768.1 hypothetical protein [Bacillus paranthracis]MDA2160252.1 hypothetical protein [Bacillus cereus group sp. Bc252]HDR7786428.1 hypothetical protein [Bacillus paranthracis]
MRYKLCFSIDEEDKEILLHLGNGIIISFATLDEYEDFIKNMKEMKEEIKESL